MAREKEYLKAIEANKVIAVGDIGAKSVKVTGLKDGTKYSDITVAYDKDNTTALSDGASEPTAVPEFTTVKAVVNVTGVSLDKTTLSLDTGKTGQLTATVVPSNATNKAVSYSSDTTSVATVDNNGKVTAVKAGTAKITVKTTDQAKTATCTVTVTDPVVNVTGISLDKTEASVEEGATTQLTATVSPVGASDKSVTWKSGNEATATVDQTGKVTGVKAGTVNVVVTTKDGSKTATCAVTVTAKPTEPAPEG